MTRGFAKGVPLASQRARVSMSATRVAYIGPSLNLAPHTNGAATVALALQSPFELTLFNADGAGGPRQTTRIAVIPPGTLHHLAAHGDMVFIYLDALSDDFRAFQALDLQAAHQRCFNLGDDNTTKPQTATSFKMTVDAICTALGVPARRVMDTRLTEVVRLIDASPQDFGSVDRAAAMARLSASRFQVVFRHHVGMPFRRYRQWRRMTRVMQLLATGTSLTQAAMDAGFASSAHLSTAFKAMFGVTPSGILTARPRLVLSTSA
jgi:AraC-like DNA-binding protein